MATWCALMRTLQWAGANVVGAPFMATWCALMRTLQRAGANVVGAPFVATWCALMRTLPNIQPCYIDATGTISTFCTRWFSTCSVRSK